MKQCLISAQALVDQDEARVQGQQKAPAEAGAFVDLFAVSGGLPSTGSECSRHRSRDCTTRPGVSDLRRSVPDAPAIYAGGAPLAPSTCLGEANPCYHAPWCSFEFLSVPDRTGHRAGSPPDAGPRKLRVGVGLLLLSPSVSTATDSSGPRDHNFSPRMRVVTIRHARTSVHSRSDPNQRLTNTGERRLHSRICASRHIQSSRLPGAGPETR